MPIPIPTREDDQACLRFLETLGTHCRVLCVKTYRVSLELPDIALIPCLDHEAALRGRPAPHISVYVKDAQGEFHELAYTPSEGSVIIDCASTLAETAPADRQRFLAQLQSDFPALAVSQTRPSFTRGDRRVANVVRAQLRLSEVLEGDNEDQLRWKLERLRAVADFMEKHSRATSWGVRTLTPPLLTGASVGSYLLIGLLGDGLLEPGLVEALRYIALTVLGIGFLWWGMKAVHLTEMGSRVWKRSTEYKLILEARKRLPQSLKRGQPPLGVKAGAKSADGAGEQPSDAPSSLVKTG